jgi:hypothetical protein
MSFSSRGKLGGTAIHVRVCVHVHAYTRAHFYMHACLFCMFVGCTRAHVNTKGECTKCCSQDVANNIASIRQTTRMQAERDREGGREGENRCA